MHTPVGVPGLLCCGERKPKSGLADTALWQGENLNLPEIVARVVLTNRPRQHRAHVVHEQRELVEEGDAQIHVMRRQME